jgi:uncharacterized lipoprotein YddW (UPF0748 family)
MGLMKNNKFFSLIMLMCFILGILQRNTVTVLGAVEIPTETPYNKSEFRGVWLSTAYNIDWKAISSSYTASQQKQDYVSKLNEVKNSGMNAIIFQARPMGDAFYQSSYAPWSQYVSGTQGTNPGYDPLAYTLEEAHKKNLEFHAWFNPFRISASKSFSVQNYLSKLPAGNQLKAHPEWIVKYSDSENVKTYYWLNLGIPEVRQYVINTIMEVVNKYDVDGIHLDDYFYPYAISGVDFPDENQYKQYGAAFNSKGDWRRDNVNKFIQGLSTQIKAKKSYVKFGISPFGIWKNGTSIGGSDTNGLSSYDSLYCDTVKWINNQWVDYIVPQIYWNFGYSKAAYEKLIDWWTKQVSGKNVHLYIGHAVYKAGDSSYGEAWMNPKEIPNQIKYNRQFSNIKGSVLFSLSDVLSNKLAFKDALASDLYKYQSLIPSMTWKDNTKPQSPVISKLEAVNEGNKLTWSVTSLNDINSYVIYRFNVGETIDISNSKKIIAAIRKGTSTTTSYIDAEASETQKYSYVVTAVDRLYNESAPSNTVTNGPDADDPTTIEQLVVDKPTSQTIFKAVNITAKAISAKPVLYKFTVSDGINTRVLKNYSASTTCQWVPTKIGSYKIKVEVKANDSKNAFDAAKEIDYKINGLYKVFLDPGHGGKDSGAPGPTGALEKNINLSVAEKVKRQLGLYGFEIMMSRDEDKFIELDQRAAMANNWKSNIFISIHQNSFGTTANGIETFYYTYGSTQSKSLATKVQNRLIESTGAKDRGVKTASFVVIKKTNMPSVLIECGFISNANEEAKLKTEAYQKLLSNSISGGVFDYFNIYKEDLNKDGTVSKSDLTQISKNYNNKVDDNSMDKYQDLNDDGIVDIFDMSVVSKGIK